MEADKNKDVAIYSDTVSRMAAHWPMLDALMSGTLAMRQAGRLFLPQWPNEDGESYLSRISVSSLYPAFSRTVKVMAAKPFSDSVLIGHDLPSKIQEIYGDCDQLGTGIEEYFADLMIDCLSHGLAGVYVDYSGMELARTVAEEKALGYRPCFKAYKCSSILGFKLKNNNLAQLRLKENVQIPDGEFLEKSVEQIRVLEPGKWTTYRKNEKLEWVEHESGFTTLRKIPFVFFYGLKEGFGVGASPLIDLAYMNVDHWQSSSDQQNILHVARVPVLFAKGFRSDESIIVGASTATVASSMEASLQWVEHSGRAISAGRDAILDLEGRMIAAGAELIVKRSGNITATQVSSEDNSNASILKNIVEEFEDSIRSCLCLAAEQVGIVDYSPEVQLFKNFTPSSSDSVAAILQSHSQQIITTAEARAELAGIGLFSMIDAEASAVNPVETTQ